MSSRRLAPVGCLLALSLAGCASDAPPPNLIPPPPAEATVEQLSGDFCYFGPDFSLRTFRRDPKLIPFLDVDALGEPTKVSVEATAERVFFTYTNRDGVEVQEAFLPAKFKARWKEGALVVPWKEIRPNVAGMIGINVVGNALGLVLAGMFHSDSYSPGLYLGGRNRESRLYRLADGRLVMTDTFRASGDLKQGDMASSSWERQDSVALLLDPAAGDCSAGPGRPPEAWYGQGVDLRKPDCAAELEEQTVAILVAKGEEPVQARPAVKEGLAEVLAGEEAGTTFHVLCPEGVTYTLWFGKDASGCAVKLMEHERKRGKGVSRTTWSSGTQRRPLTACDCN